MASFGARDDRADRSASRKSSPRVNATTPAPVAVVGMACRLPGNIHSPDQFWNALLRGDDLVTEIPADRWDADDYYDPEPGAPGRSASRWGAFLDDVGDFDSEFFGIDEKEAAALDPQHRLLLENSWEAMENAGLTPESLRESLTGVFMGLTRSDYQLVTAGSSDVKDGRYCFRGNNFGMASGRISHALGLGGPALTVDTAGSSSLVAVHMACRSLNDGESDLAFAGGAFIVLDPRYFIAETALGRLSPTGRCHAFDVAADGYVCGEGSGVVLLKRLSDALRDGDRILAVVRGTAMNHNGRTDNVSEPSRSAQTAVYEAALESTGVHARSVGMVEAHGTGTWTDDQVEYTGLSTVYGVEKPCALTSMKTNFGYAESASGVLGLMKAVLAVRHGVIPPNLHFTRLPDDLARTDTKLFVPKEITPWPTEGQHPRRAAVSSFGVSGTNAHAVVEQGPHEVVSREAEAATPTTSLLFPISATTADELRRTAGRTADWLLAHDGVALQDLAYTLTRRRAHRPLRTVVVASSRSELVDALHQVAAGNTPYVPAVGHDDRGPVWVFSGQASQWGERGAQLLATEPIFAAAVGRMEPMIARECGFSVVEAISAPDNAVGRDRVELVHFTIQVALAATLREYGVRPGAVIGHSLGEAAAAVVAGALSLEDGLRVICRRSQLMMRLTGDGAMASVELPAKQVLSELTMRRVKDVVVAVAASPQTTVISGAAQTVRDMVAAWEQREVTAREIITDVAVHSPQVDPILDELNDALAELNPLTPDIPFYSATQFDPREVPVCGGRYWVDNLRRTVRFAAAVRAALEDGYRVFAELGADPVLTDAMEQTARSLDMSLCVLTSMDQPLPNGLRGFVADLHCAGAAIDYAALCPDARLIEAPLPTWTHRRLMVGSGSTTPGTQNAGVISVHPLLGQHVRLGDELESHVWQAQIETASQPWMTDYTISGATMLPPAAYCDMALTVARSVLGTAAEVCDIRFERALCLDEPTTVNISATVEAPGRSDFAIHTNIEGEKTQHASATLCSAEDEPAPTHDMSLLRSAHPHREDGSLLRERIGQHGVQYGPAFAGVRTVHFGDQKSDSVLAELSIPRQIRSQLGAYGVHPALLDACFQSVAAHPEMQALRDIPMLPLGITRLHAYGEASNARYCYTRLITADAVCVQADLDLLDDDGSILLAVRGLRLGPEASEEDRRRRMLSERLLAVEWMQRQLPEVPRADAGRWLLINAGDADVMAAELSSALTLCGAQSRTMSWLQDIDTASRRVEVENELRLNGFSGVVILTDQMSGDLDERSPLPSCKHVQHLTHIVRVLSEIPSGSPRLYVVARNARIVVAGDRVNMRQAGLRGLMRAVGAEHPHLHAVQIDIDETTNAEQLTRQLLSGSEEDETAWRDGEWYTARLTVAPLRADERRSTIVSPQREGMRLHVRALGDPKSVELVTCERVRPGPGQIEVAVTTSSVNFMDVLLATGRLPAAGDHVPQLGMDFAGVVTAVGSGVLDHRVGDRVGGVANGCWRSFITCDADSAVPLPPGLSAERAAAVTTAYATAYCALHDRARIASGDKVLIHSATGGVGQAAIAIARAAGADVFATAGSTERRQLLRDMNVEHVYDSRELDFAEAIRFDTGGYGVDVVLSSLTGAAQRAGIELLADGGRFVDIGVGNMHGDSRLGVMPFHRNLAFNVLNLRLMSQTHPQRVQRLLRTVYSLVADGALPMPECTHYPMADAADAVDLMNSAQHTGKLVLDIPCEGSTTVTVPPEQVSVFRSDGAYIVTAGLSRLGLLLAEKMAAAGCGRVVLCSQTQPTFEAMRTVERINRTGADIAVEYGDIAQPDAARRMVAVATATGLPVRGVLHLDALGEDATLSDLTDEIIEHHWEPQVHGAWNLHTATAGQPLDWLCLFTSAAELIGAPGQGAYTAANSWLTAFAQWRRAHALPATAIAWGDWATTSRTAGATPAIAADEGFYALEAILRYDRASTGYASIADTQWLTTLPDRSPFLDAFRSPNNSSAATNKLRDELKDLAPHERPTRLRRMISDQISLILRRSIDPDRPLAEYGVDSLGAMELRTRVEGETGIRLTSGDIASTSIRDLATLLCERLELVEAG
jgi:polyketide synthase 5